MYLQFLIDIKAISPVCTNKKGVIKIKQKTICDKFGFDHTVLSRIRRGKKEVTTLNTVSALALCSILKCTIIELLKMSNTEINNRFLDLYEKR